MIFLDRLSSTVNRGIEYLLGGLGVSMALIVALQVFYRYALNSSLFWSEELARYILIWMTFLGTSVAYFRGLHPGIDILTIRLSPLLRRASALIIHLLSCLFFSVMIIYGTQFAYFVHRQVSPALALPKWIVYSVIPVSGIILFVHGITFFVRVCKGEDLDN